MFLPASEAMWVGIVDSSILNWLPPPLTFLCLSFFTGSIAAITVTVIAVVLLVFGAAAYLKIR